jgi:hypothetical protein
VITITFVSPYPQFSDKLLHLIFAQFSLFYINPGQLNFFFISFIYPGFKIKNIHTLNAVFRLFYFLRISGLYSNHISLLSSYNRRYAAHLNLSIVSLFGVQKLRNHTTKFIELTITCLQDTYCKAFLQTRKIHGCMQTYAGRVCVTNFKNKFLYRNPANFFFFLQTWCRNQDQGCQMI